MTRVIHKARGTYRMPFASYVTRFIMLLVPDHSFLVDNFSAVYHGSQSCVSIKTWDC